MAKSAVRRFMLLLCFSLALCAQAPLPPQHTQDQSPRALGTPVFAPESYSQLKYRYIGPVGNRATAVVGIPGNPWIYYVGAEIGRASCRERV